MITFDFGYTKGIDAAQRIIGNDLRLRDEYLRQRDVLPFQNTYTAQHYQLESQLNPLKVRNDIQALNQAYELAPLTHAYNMGTANIKVDGLGNDARNYTASQNAGYARSLASTATDNNIVSAAPSDLARTISGNQTQTTGNLAQGVSNQATLDAYKANPQLLVGAVSNKMSSDYNNSGIQATVAEQTANAVNANRGDIGTTVANNLRTGALQSILGTNTATQNQAVFDATSPFVVPTATATAEANNVTANTDLGKAKQAQTIFNSTAPYVERTARDTAVAKAIEAATGVTKANQAQTIFDLTSQDVVANAVNKAAIDAGVSGRDLRILTGTTDNAVAAAVAEGQTKVNVANQALAKSMEDLFNFNSEAGLRAKERVADNASRQNKVDIATQDAAATRSMLDSGLYAKLTKAKAEATTMDSLNTAQTALVQAQLVRDNFNNGTAQAVLRAQAQTKMITDQNSVGLANFNAINLQSIVANGVASQQRQAQVNAWLTTSGTPESKAAEFSQIYPGLSYRKTPGGDVVLFQDGTAARLGDFLKMSNYEDAVRMTTLRNATLTPEQLAAQAKDRAEFNKTIASKVLEAYGRGNNGASVTNVLSSLLGVPEETLSNDPAVSALSKGKAKPSAKELEDLADLLAGKYGPDRGVPPPPVLYGPIDRNKVVIRDGLLLVDPTTGQPLAPAQTQPMDTAGRSAQLKGGN
ncbi:hypothetical protein V757_11240 [Pelistega indica]|uniref:Uncharacterized protein n=1 Tax=Pelistega indica TaxID=1414851 RepID=V8FUK9_9BURK|nr:hypothetical protein [Pelistega indica]ETD67556.1 hypothetical protein V757_11240 [Pelistega indica]